jgi:hypothetical protein
MRLVRYRTPGQPPADAKELEELVMLTQAALTIANTERRVLDRDAPQGVPATVQSRLSDESNNSYEVTVVDRFYTLSQRAFERRGQQALWERTFPKATTVAERRGRRKSIDISLFDAHGKRETRLEFGFFTAAKVQQDAAKLHELARSTVPGYDKPPKNYLIHWLELADEKLTRAMDARKKTFADAADAASATTSGYKVDMRVASGVDVFSETKSKSRVTYVALFEVVPTPGPSNAP